MADDDIGALHEEALARRAFLKAWERMAVATPATVVLLSSPGLRAGLSCARPGEQGSDCGPNPAPKSTNDDFDTF